VLGDRSTPPEYFFWSLLYFYQKNVIAALCKNFFQTQIQLPVKQGTGLLAQKKASASSEDNSFHDRAVSGQGHQTRRPQQKIRATKWVCLCRAGQGIAAAIPAFLDDNE